MLTKGRGCPKHIPRVFGALRSSSELLPLGLKFTSAQLSLCSALSRPILAQKTNLQDLITSVIGHYFSAGSRAASPQSCGCTSLSSPQIHSFTFASGSPSNIVRILQSGQGGWRTGRRRGSESGRGRLKRTETGCGGETVKAPGGAEPRSRQIAAKEGR